MKLKKVLALVLSAALVVSAFAGCGGKSPAPRHLPRASQLLKAAQNPPSPPPPEIPPRLHPVTLRQSSPLKTVDAAKTISLNAGMEPTGLNTLTSTYAIEFSLFKHMYENLVTLDDDDNTVRAQLRAGTTMRDTLTYTFHLRKDGVWTNGDRLRRKTSSLLGVRL